MISFFIFICVRKRIPNTKCGLKIGKNQSESNKKRWMQKKKKIYTPLYNNQINTQPQITPPHICKCINYVTRLNVYMYTHMYAHICKCLHASTYMYIHIRLRLTQLNSICTHYHPTIGHRETNHHLTSHCPTWNIPQLWTYKHTCTMLLQIQHNANTKCNEYATNSCPSQSQKTTTTKSINKTKLIILNKNTKSKTKIKTNSPNKIL